MWAVKYQDIEERKNNFKMLLYIMSVNCEIKDISKNFNQNISKTVLGYGARDSKLSVDQMGVAKDIVQDIIPDIGLQDLATFEEIVRERMKALDERKIKAHYQGVTDDRFNQYEHIIDPGAKSQNDHYKDQKVGYYDKTAFKTRSRDVRQRCDVWEKGQESFRYTEEQCNLYGRQDVEQSREELKNTELFRYKQIDLNEQAFDPRTDEHGNPVRPIRKARGVNFSGMLEEITNGQFGLYGGHNKSNVLDYVKNINEEYNQVNTRNAGNNYNGRFSGGFQRRAFLDAAANNKKPDHLFSLDKTNIDLDAYYYDYGASKKPDALVDKLDSYDDDGKVMTINI